MTVCIVDTTIICELLAIPGKSNRTQHFKDELDCRIETGELLLLPLTVLIETGNHIAQGGDGRVRRLCAEKFVAFARVALAGASPFVTTPLPERDQVGRWLDDFPERAMTGVGLGDRSLIALWEHQRTMVPQHRIYIWSLDHHLSAFDHQP